ncbi:hypothetical protein SAMN05660649_04257 [Desulfotomaculum arcticum]|uniref:Uncharacterized protein n=1 Tax=Desulfotruncus arcticus DSM 17038 TaxID=1121424 RepID=A0A1I2Y9M7_9FIRM|nr:hypothetical protein [Desulfotruncus arcticus]SFH21071.1 hypothetical protein SAMN05660649_04257 [Desulfotomaculum arcticum] [Desulfotruncus arcticus DSM 17038]
MPPDPFKELVSVLEMRMTGNAAKAVAGVPCELGTITATGIKLDKFKHEIQDYLLADWLVKMYLPDFSITGTQSGLKDSLGGAVTGTATFEFEASIIDQVRLELKTGLKPGDRVLAVPVNGGQDAVIVAKVVS